MKDRLFVLKVSCCHECPDYDEWDMLCKNTGEAVENDEVIAPHCLLKEEE